MGVNAVKKLFDDQTSVFVDSNGNLIYNSPDSYVVIDKNTGRVIDGVISAYHTNHKLLDPDYIKKLLDEPEECPVSKAWYVEEIALNEVSYFRVKETSCVDGFIHEYISFSRVFHDFDEAQKYANEKNGRILEYAEFELKVAQEHLENIKSDYEIIKSQIKEI